jgi:CheY-like chemotaxis protein
MMERQVGQMVRLVDDLLDASRISRGKIELRRERVELSSVIYHAVEAARPLVDSLRHTLDVALPPEPVWLDADPSRLAQIVGNLLNNACKFTDAGGRISLDVERDGSDVTIKVRDSGMGFSAEQRVRIFDMFMQADTSLGRPVSGLGIGLPLARRLAEIHGGILDASSAGAGQGSEFVVRLPVMTQPHAVAPLPPGTPRPRPEVAGTGARVLVVDDNRDAAQSLAHLLSLSGFVTEMAYDGLAAVSAAETFRPHAVLLDIGLPLLDGYGAASRIRSQPWGKRAVLVALTGWGQDHDRLKSSEAGFDHHLVKPADIDSLLALLDQVSVPAMEGEKPFA